MRLNRRVPVGTHGGVRGRENLFNFPSYSIVVQSCGRIVHEFYGTIYANKENGKLESNKRMWLYEKIHISILGNRVSVTYSKEV